MPSVIVVRTCWLTDLPTKKALRLQSKGFVVVRIFVHMCFHGWIPHMNCVDSPQFVRTSQGNVITSLIHWCKSLSIKPQHKALVRSLIDYHGQDGRCYPSISRLADELNCSRHTIHRWLNILEQEGILSRVLHCPRHQLGQ